MIIVVTLLLVVLRDKSDSVNETSKNNTRVLTRLVERIDERQLSSEYIESEVNKVIYNIRTIHRNSNKILMWSNASILMLCFLILTFKELKLNVRITMFIILASISAIAGTLS